MLDGFGQLLEPLRLQGELAFHLRLPAGFIRHVHANAQRNIVGNESGKDDQEEYHEHLPTGKDQIER